MNIYKSVGLDWLLDKDVWEELNNHITENTRYMIPGYKYNYRLCTLPGYIEFHRCELLDRTPIKTDIHISANYHWKLEVSDIISAEAGTHIYALKSKSGEIFSARISSPDTLPSVKSGDMLEGQVVAFADKIVKLKESSSVDGKIYSCDENCVNLNCVITKYMLILHLQHFVF